MKPRTFTDQSTTLEGDVIEAVEVQDAAGNVIQWKKGDNLDPIRLPQQLKQWADALWKATDNKPSAEQRKVKLTVKRRNAQNAEAAFAQVVVELPWDDSWRWDRVMAFSFTSPQAIPELGLAYLVKNEVDAVDPDVATSSPFKVGDEIVDVNFVYAKSDTGATQDSGWQAAKAKKAEVIKGTEWAHINYSLQSPLVVKVKVKVKRGSETEEIEVTPRDDKTWPSDERGLLLTLDSRIEKADSVLHAIEMGFRDTHRSMMQVYLHLRGLFAGTISVENLGGPVEITRTAYRVAQYDIWDFMFFLGLISVNLAVLNFLPIPVLDGGHMVFLVYEKLRGKPASEGVRVGATYAGLLLIGCLMIFVLVLDIRRLVGG